MEKNDLEALRMLQDWSKWLAAIDLAALGAFGTKVTSPSDLISVGGVTFLLGLTAFFVSVVSATWLLLSLPGIAQRLPPPVGQDIFMMGTLEGEGIRLVYFVVCEHVALLVGVTFFLSHLLSQRSNLAAICAIVIGLSIIVVVAGRHKRGRWASLQIPRHGHN